MNFNLTVGNVAGRVGGGRAVITDIGVGLKRMIDQHGAVGITAGSLGTNLPSVDLNPLPADVVVLDLYGSGFVPVTSYADLDSSGDAGVINTVYCADPAGTALAPLPSLRAWCEGLGGTYQQGVQIP